uniref:Uncharacterized protein n=1 Tax=Anguilla anguilla TaxID=7936 RepID=A0A0E9UJX4_ANGAN
MASLNDFWETIYLLPYIPLSKWKPIYLHMFCNIQLEGHLTQEIYHFQTG